MKKIIITMMAAVLVAGVASAADVSMGVDFASAYVFRGTTFNDGFVAQPWAEISGFPIDEKYGSIVFGVWGNYDIDDIDNNGTESNMSEVDYYVSYALPVTVVDLSVTYTEYTYKGDVDSDKEVALSIGKALGDSGLYSSFTANYGVGGGFDEEWYLVAGLDYETSLSDNLSLSAGLTAGYLVSEDEEPDQEGFNDATASVGLSYSLDDNWSVGASVTYIEQLDDDVLASRSQSAGVQGYETDLLGMISISCDF